MTAVAEVCSMLEQRSVQVGGRELISYGQFAASREECREKYGSLYDACFWPRVFLTFPGLQPKSSEFDDLTIYVETRFLQKYVHHFGRLLRAKKELESIAKKGRLSVEDIEHYCGGKLHTLYSSRTKNRSHLSSVCKLATMKFRFYHERKGELKVSEVAHGLTLWEMERALEAAKQPMNASRGEAANNWFSEKVMFAILDSFSNAAGGYDGVLTLALFTSISAFSTLSPLFSTNLFRRLKYHQHSATCINGMEESCMDLENYGKIVIAWNDRSSDVAVKYLFKIFDPYDKGYLTFQDILEYVQETVELLRMAEATDVYEGMAQDITIEMFDMVGPQLHGQITERDIIQCKNGFEIFGMMADATELFRHEHRDD